MPQVLRGKPDRVVTPPPKTSLSQASAAALRVGPRPFLLAAAAAGVWLTPPVAGAGVVAATPRPVVVAAPAPASVVVAPPAPAPVAVVVGRAPAPGEVWSPGYWSWANGRYVWIEGHWGPVRYGFHYVCPHWATTPAGWTLPGVRG
jgi:hypothetical protein